MDDKQYDEAAVVKMLAALIAVEGSGKRLNTIAVVLRIVTEGLLAPKPTRKSHEADDPIDPAQPSE